MWANYSIDQNVQNQNDQNDQTGHMFNIKLKEKSCKMSFKALPVKIQKIQRPKTDKQRGGEWGILNA